MALVMVFCGVSGVFMWWQLKGMRIWGRGSAGDGKPFGSLALVYGMYTVVSASKTVSGEMGRCTACVAACRLVPCPTKSLLGNHASSLGLTITYAASTAFAADAWPGFRGTGDSVAKATTP